MLKVDRKNIVFHNDTENLRNRHVVLNKCRNLTTHCTPNLNTIKLAKPFQLIRVLSEQNSFENGILDEIGANDALK